MGLVVRADGSPRMGLGHLLRTLAVAEEATARDIPVRYVSVDDPVLDVLTRRGIDVQRIADAAALDWLDDLDPGDVVLQDGYHLGHDLRPAVRDAGLRIGAVVDAASGHHDVDVLIDPSPVAAPVRLPAGAIHLSGPGAALIRREFRRHRRGRTAARRVLVVLGGSDAAGLTRRLSDAVAAVPAVERVTVLLGPGAAAAGDPVGTDDGRVEVVVDPADLAAVFAAADLAVASASTVAWELLSTGVPVVAVQIADNQREVAAYVGGAGLGRAVRGDDPGVATQVTAAVAAMVAGEELARCSERALAAVDGRGAERAVTALMRAPGEAPDA